MRTDNSFEYKYRHLGFFPFTLLLHPSETSGALPRDRERLRQTASPSPNSPLTSPLSGTPPPDWRPSSVSSLAAGVTVPGGGSCSPWWRGPAAGANRDLGGPCSPWGGGAAPAPSSLLHHNSSGGSSSWGLDLVGGTAPGPLLSSGAAAATCWALGSGAALALSSVSFVTAAAATAADGARIWAVAQLLVPYSLSSSTLAVLERQGLAPFSWQCSRRWGGRSARADR
jgi:hypothetical protein